MIKKFLEYFRFDSFFLTKKYTYFFYKFFIVNRLRNLFFKNNLHKILNFKKINFYKKDLINEPISRNLKKQYNPEIIDLARIYNFIKKEKPFTILEFGVGYSTIVMAQALYENYCTFDKDKKKKIRNSKMFQIYSVDTSKKWITNTSKKIPNHLRKFIKLNHSKVKTILYNGEVCHVYSRIPDINPEFIYLDGPHPLDPVGNINNISFNCKERTPISADICFLESTLLPGTSILVDGRTNNVRFLERNLKRKYQIKWDRHGDVTFFKLTEKRLGNLNKLGFEFFS